MAKPLMPELIPAAPGEIAALCDAMRDAAVVLGCPRTAGGWIIPRSLMDTYRREVERRMTDWRKAHGA